MTEDEMVDLIVGYRVLEFIKNVKLKSGKTSDHFYNFGKINTAEALNQLATCMISEIYCDDFNVLFTSAYKGIMLTSAILLECGNRFRSDKHFKMGFLRKDLKDHGETGMVVGYNPGHMDSVVLVDDVFTTGQSILEMVNFIKPSGAKIKSVIVVVNRASPQVQKEIEDSIGCPIRYLIHDEMIMEHLK